jgi:asparagine synthase (glutamine-hydrolysing)
MNTVAGLAWRDPRRPVEGRLLEALLAGIPAATGGVRLAVGGAVLAAVGAGDGAAWGQWEGGAAVADLDLTNLAEIRAQIGSDSPARLLEELARGNGAGLLREARGALALAVWSPGPRRLFLAADRFGLRRIYYAVTDAGIAFGTRARIPLALPGVAREPDPDAVYAYLNFQTVPAPQTIYRGVRRLPPGHCLRWEDGRVSVERYWDIAYHERRVRRSAAARSLFAHTEAAVREALAGCDPKRTGAFLSGGTDSSTVVGFITRLTGERAHAFSIGFEEARYNELHYAELAARHFDATHYTRLVTADEALACVPAVAAAYDEPFGNNSALPTYLCARLARETGMRLLLAGDGGDEIFGGNERYRREQILARYRLIPGRLRRGLIEPLLGALPPGGLGPIGKAQRYVERAALPNPERFYSSEFFVARERERLLHPDFRRAITPDWPLEVARRHYEAARAGSELNRLLYLDVKITLGDNDLFKVTRTAAAAGIGVRFPLLDPRLVEFTAALPAWHKVKGAEKRHLFRRAFAGFLPRAVLDKAKHGFGLPVADWLRGHRGFRELAHDTLLSARARGRGYFASGAVESLFRLHDEDRTPYYGDILWGLVMLELWHRYHAEAS